MNDAAYYLSLVHSTNFPYPEYDLEQLHKSFTNLCTKDIKPLANTGLDIVSQFHKSIWDCNVRGCKSPIEAWDDDNLMLKVIDNRLKFLKTDHLSVSHLRNGLSIAKIAPKVSIFRPALAKYLINKYLANIDTIFDPCMGFSGRMLGAAAAKKHYIGVDINSITVSEADKINKLFNLNANLSCDDSLYTCGKYECVFTCPPYGNKEHWHQDIEELSADEWITTILSNYDCNEYLFVVDHTELYSKFIMEEIENRSHFGSNNEKVVYIKRC